ncbi:hypothetical protein ACWDFH_12440 [Streptomyces kronopolitis]
MSPAFPGLCCICPSHAELLVWDGTMWRWSNQPVDLDAARPQTANGAFAVELGIDLLV